MLWAQISSAAVFAGSITASPFITKLIVNTHNFRFPCFLLFLRFLLGLVVIEGLRIGGWVKLPPFTLQRGRLFLLPSIINAVQSFCTIIAMERMNVPMFAAVRQCTPLVNLVLLVVLLRKPMPSFLVIGSVLMITFGCLLAGLGDLTFDGTAYFLCIMSVVCLGAYTTLIQAATEKRLTVAEIFQINCYICVPLFFIGSYFTSEFNELLDYRYQPDVYFIGILFFGLALGNLLTYSLFMCTSLNSALTTSLVGVLKNVPQTIIGFFTFGGFSVNLLSITGLVLNTIGGTVFVIGKHREQLQKKQT